MSSFFRQTFLLRLSVAAQQGRMQRAFALQGPAGLRGRAIKPCYSSHSAFATHPVCLRLRQGSSSTIWKRSALPPSDGGLDGAAVGVTDEPTTGLNTESNGVPGKLSASPGVSNALSSEVAPAKGKGIPHRWKLVAMMAVAFVLCNMDKVSGIRRAHNARSSPSAARLFRIAAPAVAQRTGGIELAIGYTCKGAWLHAHTSTHATHCAPLTAQTMHTAGSRKLHWSASCLKDSSACAPPNSYSQVNMSVAVIPMARDLGWSATDRGLVSSSFFWGYSLTQVPAGWISTKCAPTLQAVDAGCRYLGACSSLEAADALVE